MAGKDRGKSGVRPMVIVRREEVVEGGHHGGAWKVAYADFVTAMMAFFLLMWLLNATTEDQRRGLADYFSPTNVLARGSSGFGAPFGGHTPNDTGSLASDRGAVQVMNAQARPVFDVEDDDSDVPAQSAAFRDVGESNRMTRQLQPNHSGGPAQHPGDKTMDTAAQEAAARVEVAKQEHNAFAAAAAQIRDAVAADPASADLAKQMAIDITPEGLRIQIIDEERQPMFTTGSAVPNERARSLLLKIGPVLAKLPEQLSIAGHTDAAAFRGGERTNWELSAERANATRRLLVEAGLPESRVATVTGRADRDPLTPADPLAAANRRIAITVLRQGRLPVHDGTAQ